MIAMDSNRQSDRRQEERSLLSGRVEIFFDDPNPVTVEGELIETSERGFRAKHDSSVVVPGLEVRFRRAGVSGRARVIWTHVLEGRSVSGFLILS
jgi:hypothetical protein